MSEKKTKLYVGCSLSKAPTAFVESVEELKVQLRAEGYEVFDFVGLVAGTAADVYNWDIGHCVSEADMLVGVCDEPSIGLGWEMSKSVALGHPTLAVAHTNAKVTRLVLGAAEQEPNFYFERYDDLNKDVPALVKKILAQAS